MRYSKFSCLTSDPGHSRLRWSRPGIVHVPFNSDSDRQPSKRDLALTLVRNDLLSFAKAVQTETKMGLTHCEAA